MLVDRAAVLGNDLVVPPKGALDYAAGVLGAERVGELGEAAPAVLRRERRQVSDLVHLDAVDPPALPPLPAGDRTSIVADAGMAS